MTSIPSCRIALALAVMIFGSAQLLNGQAAAREVLQARRAGSSLFPAPNRSESLRFVLVLSRHGVRSPTGKPAQYNAYSTASWPEWSVAPGYLTAHGFHLMEQFGTYDRLHFAEEGLFEAKGCGDANKVTIYADSDQRTRETGKALAQGLFPGCDCPVQSLPEGTNDTLFHPNPADFSAEEPALAVAAIEGRMGGNATNLTEAYRAQLASFDKLLATCGAPVTAQQKRATLLDIPASLTPGKGEHLADLRGPLNTASTLAENLLLEYTEGMPETNVGWGCVSGADLRSIINLHTAVTDFTQRTPLIARVQASNLLEHIARSLEQAATNKPVASAIGKPSDKALFLIGHDTNLTNIAGLLGLTWIEDGRRDDTPPGSALVFELWRVNNDGTYRVRTYFTAQTLEQMRTAAELTVGNPPARVPVFLPGCSGEDFSCPWPEFAASLHRAIDPRHVNSK